MMGGNQMMNKYHELLKVVDSHKSYLKLLKIVGRGLTTDLPHKKLKCHDAHALC